MQNKKEKKNSIQNPKTINIPFNGLRFNCLDVIILLTALRRINCKTKGEREERERERERRIE
jgi:hypothetical protein